VNDLSDQQLLRDYAGRRSEAAFAELVRRHVDLVYSAAMRMVHDKHLAEDVTQGSFLALAQNASHLTDHPALSGWLHRTAQNLATKTVRGDVRRRAREQEAAAMNESLSAEPDALWEHIAPHLDDALGELTEPDRDALLLRYFERKSAREMAQTLGVSDEDAQKRVSRAVEHLREFLAKRGVTVGTSGLVFGISTHAVQAAPVALTSTISSAAAIAGTTVAAAATKGIAMTALQKAFIVTIVAAGVATPLVVQHQNQVKLRQENQALLERIDELVRVTTQNEHSSTPAKQVKGTHTLTDKQYHELLKLRGEVGVLRRGTNEIGKLVEENRRLRRVMVQGGDFRLVTPNPPSRPDEIMPAGSINWLNADLNYHVLPIFADLANVEFVVDDYFRTLPSAMISFSNSTALTRSEVVEMIQRAVRDQAGIEIVRQGTNRAVVRPRR
jgi:RNA polymerase sigma factor (sigma-70 family)